MPVQNWSDTVILAELQDEPQYSDDMQTVIDMCTERPRSDVLLNFEEVGHLNSSNIAKLLKLRKLVVISNERRLLLCSVSPQVWGVFLVTGLEKLFDVVEDVSTGLASLQLT